MGAHPITPAGVERAAAPLAPRRVSAAPEAPGGRGFSRDDEFLTRSTLGVYARRVEPRPRGAGGTHGETGRDRSREGRDERVAPVTRRRTGPLGRPPAHRRAVPDHRGPIENRVADPRRLRAARSHHGLL